METVKESWGASCPKCGDDNCLEVSFVAWGLLVADNGFDDDGARDGSHEFDDASACQCQACGWRGTFGQACGKAPMMEAGAPRSIALQALDECASFIAGFERDDLQDGLPETLLARIATARADLQALSAESTPTPIGEAEAPTGEK